jgi:CIC family chloride channel protein
MDQAMHDQFTWKMLAALSGLKILATTLSFVSGTPGGMFAPTLFIGAMLGGAIGGVERHFFSLLTVSTGTYALVGMGVLFAAFLRAPMTSVFMVFEVSGNYSIVVPVIVANTVAYLISRSLQPVPIFDVLTRQDGLILPSLEEQREETILRGEDAMQPVPAVVLDGDGPIAQAELRVRDLPDKIFLVRMAPSGWATLTRDLLDRLMKEGKGNLTLTSVLPAQRLPHLYPDLPLDSALRHVSQSELIPVLSRADSHELEGVVTRDNVLTRYQADSIAD